jgi:D-lactate dehydrogenase
MDILIADGQPDEVIAYGQAFSDHYVIGQRGRIDVNRIMSPYRVVALAVTVPVTREDMNRLPNLKVIASRSTGTNHIDVEAATERGIVVCNAPEASVAVAEHAFALLLAVGRKLKKAGRTEEIGPLNPGGLAGVELHGKTLGIIGMGRIGAHAAQIGRGFGMHVCGYDPYPNLETPIEYTELDRLLARSDVVLVCCPLTPETRHLLGRSQFGKMKRRSILINVARGEVVESGALLSALEDGTLWGAGLDVLEGESAAIDLAAQDLRPEEALLAARNCALRHHPNVFVTPHLGYYTEECLGRVRDTTIRNIKAALEDRPINVVNPKAAPLASV